jgi:hypothetical protein
MATAIRMFYGTAITSLPEQLFYWNRQLTSHQECFRNCASLTTVPENLFRYSYASTSMQAVFRESRPSLPADLWRYCTNVTTYGFAFYRPGVRIIRPDIFGPDLQAHFDGRTVDFGSFYQGNSMTTGPLLAAPALWALTNVTFTTTSSAFLNHTTNTVLNYLDIPTAWGGPL